MPQIMIDTTTDSVESLRRFATLLQDEADSREEIASTILNVPAGTPASVVAQVTVIQADHDKAPDVDTAAIFRKSAPQPAGLDGHGGAAPLAPAAPAIAPAAVQSGTPAAPAIAPAAVPAQAPAQVGTVVLDSSGIPHDARIHQDTKKMNKNNTWQNKRGIDKDLLAAVTAELQAAWGKPEVMPAAQAAEVRAAALAPLPPPITPTPPVAPPPPPVTVATQPGAVVGGIAPLPPVNPAAPGTIVGFREFMQKVTTGTNSGKLSNDQVDAALGSVGIGPRQLIALMNKPELIPGVTAYLDACLAAAA